MNETWKRHIFTDTALKTGWKGILLKKLSQIWRYLFVQSLVHDLKVLGKNILKSLFIGCIFVVFYSGVQKNSGWYKVFNLSVSLMPRHMSMHDVLPVFHSSMATEWLQKLHRFWVLVFPWTPSPIFRKITNSTSGHFCSFCTYLVPQSKHAIKTVYRFSTCRSWLWLKMLLIHV